MHDRPRRTVPGPRSDGVGAAIERGLAGAGVALPRVPVVARRRVVSRRRPNIGVAQLQLALGRDERIERPLGRPSNSVHGSSVAVGVVPPPVGRHWLDLGALTLLIVAAAVAGVAAAAVGGSWSDLGSGYGGLYGLPAMLLTVLALIVIPASIVVARRLGAESARLRFGLLIGVGLWVVAMGYWEVAHIVDPCANGWWDEQSRIGSQPLCERFGSELNWHDRFHLLAHATPAAALLGVYLYLIKRWGSAQQHGHPP